MRHLHSPSLLFFSAITLALSACGGGGGGGGASQLRPGVSLTASYTVETRITAVEGPAGSAVGEVSNGTVAIVQSGNTLTVDPGTPEAQTGTLNGLTCRFVSNTSDGTVTITSDTTVTFAADGLSFTGTGREAETDTSTNTTIAESFSIRGTRIGTGNSAQAFVQGLTVSGNAAAFQEGALPAASGGPAVTATGPAAVLLGGTSVVRVEPAAAIDAIAFGIEGKSGHYLATVPSSTTARTVVLQLSQSIPDATFRCQYQARAGGNWGAPSVLQVNRTNAGTGQLQVALSWDTDSDLDLHMIEPGGFEIFYEEPQSPAGGRLDVDGNANCENSGKNENITYAGTPPAGEYIVRVDHYQNCSGRLSNYVVRVNRTGQAPLLRSGQFASASQGSSGGPGSEVVRFTR
jgi:hypothetical protein